MPVVARRGGIRWLVVWLGLLAVGSVRPLTADEAVGVPYLRGDLWTTSQVVGFPEPPPPYQVERAFPRLKFESPIYLAVEPEADRLFVLQRFGKVLAFRNEPDPPAADLVLEVTGRDCYSVCFHPRYRENGYMYLFSNNSGTAIPNNRVSRFELGAACDSACVLASEQVIIEWESNGHNGGDMAFGPDGCLYITAGDGTSSSDPHFTGQDLSDLPSSMIRIDVDHPDEGRAYSIPADNPFVGRMNVRPEIWAYGFRNPWRLSFDPLTGDLWLGDIGQDAWEMIYLVRRAGNYGWAVQEGSHPFQPRRLLGPTPIVPPVIEHPHSEARSIVGGMVYHGAKFPDLQGQYVYGDYETGRIWGARWDGEKVVSHRELASTRMKFLNLAVDPAGEVLLADFFGGDIFRLMPTPQEVSRPPFPTKLSETGLFASVPEHRPAAGLIPYEVNSPLWSDGAHKERYIALPGAATIDFSLDTTWTLPEGSVLVKTFSLALDSADPASRRRVETRLLTRQEGHWHGYSYAWNDEQTEATLVTAAGADRTYTVADAAAGSRQQVWHYPSRAECMMCHSRAAAWVLGMNTGQMNRHVDYGGLIENQISRLSAHGVFTRPAEEVPGVRLALANPADPRVPLEARVRSYLHVNCALCHVEDGGGNARMVLGYATPLAKTVLVGVRPQHDALGVAKALLVAPGDPDRSLLVKRMETLGPGRMPRLATSVVDQQAVELLREWIAQLPEADDSD